MPLSSILRFAAEKVAEAVRPGDAAVDATVGHGHDASWLARLVGPTGRVLGLDIQAEAIASARRRLEADGLSERVELVEAGHETLADRLPALAASRRVAAAMFNLGYLPKGDHSLTTRPETTLRALTATVDWVTPGGLITIVAYPGHPGGDRETQAVLNWASALVPDRALVLRYEFADPRQPAPVLVAVEPKARPIAS